jgi:hypothetical protein
MFSTKAISRLVCLFIHAARVTGNDLSGFTYEHAQIHAITIRQRPHHRSVQREIILEKIHPVEWM